MESAGEQSGRGADAPAAAAGYVALLRENRDFRLLWLGQVVSQLGDWFNTIAIFTLVLRVTGSGEAVSLVLVARFLPSVALGPVSGVLADRFNRRHIMIASDVARALVVVGFLFVRSPEQVWLVYLLTVLQLAFSAFFEPARSAALPSVVAPRDLVTANAISAVTWSAMLTLGAAVGGPVTDLFGTDAAFVIDSLTYLLSAALVWRLRLPKRAPRPKTRLTLAKALGVTDTVEGLRYVRRRPRVLAFLLVKPAWGLGGGILTLLPVFGEKVFRLSIADGVGGAALGMSVLYAARGVGTAVGPVVVRRFYGETRGQMQRAIGLSFVVAGALYASFGVERSFALALCWLAVAHMAGSVLWVFSTVLLQSSVEDEFRGRVFGAELMLMTLTMAASNYATGKALDRFQISPRAVTVAIGVFFILPGLLWFVTRRRWDRGVTPSAPTPPG